MTDLQKRLELFKSRIHSREALQLIDDCMAALASRAAPAHAGSAAVYPCGCGRFYCPTHKPNYLPDAAAPPAPPPADGDEERWRLVKRALQEPKLTATGKLVAVGAIAYSRDPHSEADQQRTRELAVKFGWDSAAPLPPPAETGDKP
jgi:hypothetical protein